MESNIVYYKYDGENRFGEEGITYIEFTDELSTREIRIYQGKTDFFTYPEDKFDMCDVPLYHMLLTDNELISKEEFEQVWNSNRSPNSDFDNRAY
jgi:hypothetical protein